MNIEDIKIWDILCWNDYARKGESFLWWKGDGELSYCFPIKDFLLCAHRVNYGKFGLTCPKIDEEPDFIGTQDECELYGGKVFLEYIIKEVNNV